MKKRFLFTAFAGLVTALLGSRAFGIQIDYSHPAPQDMKLSQVYYGRQIKALDGELVNSPLNLYPGYARTLRDPELDFDPVDNPKLDMSLVIATGAFVSPRAPNMTDLSKLATLEKLGKLEPSAQIELIPASDPHAGETDIDKKAPSWCPPGTLCVRSSFEAPRIARDKFKRDSGRFILDSEIKSGQAALDAVGGHASARLLTGIDSPVHSVYVQTVYRTNLDTIRFLKVIAIAQSHPKDRYRTIVTGFVVAGFPTEHKKRHPKTTSFLLDDNFSEGFLTSMARYQCPWKPAAVCEREKLIQIAEQFY